MKNYKLKIALLFILIPLSLFLSCNAQILPSIGGMQFPQNISTPTGPECIEYGLLYNWFAISGSGSSSISSSDDWTVLTKTQFDAARTYVGGSNYSYKVKEVGYDFWEYNASTTPGTNETGLTYRGVGYRDYTGAFANKLRYIYVWESSYDITRAWQNNVRSDNDSWGGNVYNKKAGFSVRLVKSASGISDGETTTYTGNDGQEYTAVALNQLYWTQQNLKETKLRDGTIIPFHGADNDTAFTNAEWAALTTAGVCAWGNNLNNVGCAFVFPTE